MRRAGSIAVMAVAVLVVLAVPAWAGGVGSWTPVTTPGQGNSSQIGAARTGDGVLHVLYGREDGPNVDSILHVPISPAGAVGGPNPVVGGWTSATDPVVVPTSSGLLAFFAGIHSTDPDDPLVGLIATGSPDGVTWSPPGNVDPRTADYGYARTPGATVGADGTPFETWYNADQVVVHRGFDPAVAPFVFDQASGGACCNLDSNVAFDPATGAIAAAWCAGNESPGGIWAQLVDPGTGAPVGQPSRMPGRDPQTLCEVSQPTPLVARAGGGLFTAASTGYPSASSVLVWRLGATSSMTVGSLSGQDLKVPALAAVPDGRVWVGWIQPSSGGVRVVLRRSNKGVTQFGAPVTLKPPTGTASGYALNLNAQGQVVDVLARFGNTAGDIAVWHTQADPGLTLKASRSKVGRGGGKVRFRVLDAGDPVKGAKVAGGGDSAKTDAKGRATLSFKGSRKTRTVKVKATRAGYTSASRRIKVR